MQAVRYHALQWHGAGLFLRASAIDSVKPPSGGAPWPGHLARSRARFDPDPAMRSASADHGRSAIRPRSGTGWKRRATSGISVRPGLGLDAAPRSRTRHLSRRSPQGEDGSVWMPTGTTRSRARETRSTRRARRPALPARRPRHRRARLHVAERAKRLAARGTMRNRARNARSSRRAQQHALPMRIHALGGRGYGAFAVRQ